MVFTYSSLATLSSENSTKEKGLQFYDKSEAIPLPDNGVWQVCRGIVQLSQLSLSGDEITLGWAQQKTLISFITAFKTRNWRIYQHGDSFTRTFDSPKSC